MNGKTDLCEDLKSLESAGDQTFMGKDLANALANYNNALELAETDIAEAELLHKEALCLKAIGDYGGYYRHERVSAEIWSLVSSDQAGDFMKVAGDVLALVQEERLSKSAYLMASHYFTKASAVETETWLGKAWLAWSWVCRVKAGEEPDGWGKAGRLFGDVADDKRRRSQSRACLAQDLLSRSDFLPALTELEAAAVLDPENERLPVSRLACQYLVGMQKFGQKSRGLDQLLRLTQRTTLAMPAAKLITRLNSPEGRDMTNSLVTVTAVFGL